VGSMPLFKIKKMEFSAIQPFSGLKLCFCPWMENVSQLYPNKRYDREMFPFVLPTFGMFFIPEMYLSGEHHRGCIFFSIDVDINVGHSKDMAL
jgi:hypothetical protein